MLCYALADDLVIPGYKYRNLEIFAYATEGSWRCGLVDKKGVYSTCAEVPHKQSTCTLYTVQICVVNKESNRMHG